MLLPRIQTHAQFKFRHIACPATKADKIAEVTALAWKWFLRLAERDKDPAQFLSVFADLLTRNVRCGRRLVGAEKAKDVLSPVAQCRHNFTVEPLPSSNCTSMDNLYAKVGGQREQDAFEERLQDNTLTPVPDQAAFRVDFPAWRATHCRRDRRMMDSLMMGERTLDVSRRFGISPGRVSQKRHEFHDDWRRFHGEEAPRTSAGAA